MINLENVGKILDFLNLAENLKNVERFMWVSSGKQESSAEHSWRVALMAMVLSNELNFEVDVKKSIMMALVHDLVESVCGDTNFCDVAVGKISLEEKRKKEFDAIEKIRNSLPEKTGELVFSLWMEYERALSTEARFVKAVDKLETVSQFVDGGMKNFSDEFYYLIPTYADKSLENFSELVPVYSALKIKVKDFFSKVGHEWKPEYNKFL